MATRNDFQWAINQDIVLNIQLTTQTSISGWALRFDLLNRFDSPQPIFSAFCASGFNNVSGLNVINYVGTIQVPLSHTLLSGVYQNKGALYHTMYRTDVGKGLSVEGGTITLTPF